MCLKCFHPICNQTTPNVSSPLKLFFIFAFGILLASLNEKQRYLLSAPLFLSSSPAIDGSNA